MKLQVPTTIRVGKHRYSIEVVEAMLRKHEMGRAHYDKRRIEVGRKSNTTGKRYSNTQIMDTFWHEVVHVILNEMGEHSLNNDERFVTEFANRLTQAINTAEFK